MRKYRNLQIACCLFFICNAAFDDCKAQTPAEGLTFQVFYDQLSPFGKWLKDPVNGFVWVPNVEKNFRPYYTNGSWRMTDYGTTWVSNYTWGWAPFHYGRWLYDSLYGWIWIPGTDWGPSWVVWRSDGKNYGWTPLTTGYDVYNSFSPNYYVPADWWVFLPSQNLLNPDFQKYTKSNTQYNTAMLKSSSVMNNVYTKDNINYISGPRAADYARSMNKHIGIYILKNSGKPGKAIVGAEELTLYRPGIKKSFSGQAPAPANSVAATHPIGKLSALGNTTSTAIHKSPLKKKTTAARKKKAAK